MTTIVTRAGKGSPLTNTEVDANFTNLNTAKIETLTSTDTSVTITGTGSSRDLSVPVNPNVVSGPASSTDNALVRFDGTTGKLVQNSVATVSDTGVVAGASISGASNTLTNIGNAALTNSAITINGASTSLGGAVNVGTVTSVATGTGLTGGPITGTGTIALANTAVTAGSYATANITVDAQGRITAASSGSGGVTSIAGTANQITASASTGAVTLSLPATINVNTSGNAATATTATTATTANALNSANSYSIDGSFTSSDLNTRRPGAPTTGYVYFGNTGTRYVGFDGTNFVTTMPMNFSILGSAASATNATTASTANALNAANSYTAVSFTANSDERLKTNWAGLSLDFVARLADVKHGTFERISDGTRDAGVSAQSLQKVIPEVVITNDAGFLSVNYGAAALVAAIELAKVVEELRAEIARLKAKVGE